MRTVIHIASSQKENNVAGAVCSAVGIAVIYGGFAAAALTYFACR